MITNTIMIYAAGLLMMLLVGFYGLLLGFGYVFRPYPLAHRRLIIFISFLAFFAAADLGASWAFYQTPTPQEAMTKAFTSTLAKIASAVMRKRIRFPARMNDVMRLEDVQSKENWLVYVIYVNVGDSENFVHIADQVRADMMKNACAREEYKTLMKFGLGVELDLSVENAWGADPIIITPEYCGH